jgi:hypothetical protein
MAKGSMLDRAAEFLRGLSESQLVGIMKAKRLEIKRASLQQEVDRINREISSLDQSIRKLIGGSRAGRKPGKRTGKPLKEAVLETLAKLGKPLGLTEITHAVLKNGYATNSPLKNFRTTVAHALRKLRARLVKRGERYAVKK